MPTFIREAQLGVMSKLIAKLILLLALMTIKHLLHDVCLHIAAMKPLYLHPEDVDPAILEHEKDIFKAQMANSGKPEKIIDQIIEGKINKIFTEICLLNNRLLKMINSPSMNFERNHWQNQVKISKLNVLHVLKLVPLKVAMKDSMPSKKTILLNLPAKFLLSQHVALMHTYSILLAIKSKNFSLSIILASLLAAVIFFAAIYKAKHLGLSPSVGHQIGMFATVMNGFIIKDLFEQEGIPLRHVFCALLLQKSV